MKRTLSTISEKPLSKRPKTSELPDVRLIDEHLSHMYARKNNRAFEREWFYFHNNNKHSHFQNENGLYCISSNIEDLIIHQKEFDKIRALEVTFHTKNNGSSLSKLDDNLITLNQMDNLEELVLRLYVINDHDANLETLDIVERTVWSINSDNKLKSLVFSISYDMSSDQSNDSVDEEIFGEELLGLYHLMSNANTGDILISKTTFLSKFLSVNKNIKSFHYEDEMSFFTTAQLGAFFNHMVGHCDHLEGLGFSNVAFKETNVSAISQLWWSFLEECISLKELTLCGGFSIQSLINIVNYTKKHQHLKRLHLHNLIHLQTIDKVEFSDFSKLYDLLKDHSLAYIAPFINDYFFPDTALSESQQQIIVNSITNFISTNKMEKICLKSLNILDGGESLFHIFNNSPMINHIQLVEIKGLKMEYILKILQIQNLKKLSLCGCVIDDNGLQQIAIAMKQNTTLLCLKLDCINFSEDAQLKALCTILTGNTTLQRFILNWTIFTENILNQIYHALIPSLKGNCTIWECGLPNTSSGELLFFDLSFFFKYL